MSDEADIDIDLDGDEPKRGGVVPLLMVALIGLGGGGAVGAKMLGPTVAPVLAERAMHAPEKKAKKKGGGHGGGYGDAASSLHVIDNLVVNPAQSAGTRFLLTSIAVEANDADQAEEISGRDMELRDVLITVLGSKTVNELTDVTQRPAIVEEILTALEGVLGHDVIHRIFIPQFVIQ